MENKLNKVHTICYLTSGQLFVFDKKGEQIGELQKEFQPGEQNRELLAKIANNANIFSISKWREWVQPLTKEEFMTICNLK